MLAIVEKLGTHVGIIHAGKLVAAGTLDELRRGPDGQAQSLEERFIALVGEGRGATEALAWLG